MRLLAGCDDKNTCPRIYEDGGEIVVQGVLDEEVTSVTNPGAGEAVVRVSRDLFFQAMRRLEGP